MGFDLFSSFVVVHRDEDGSELHATEYPAPDGVANVYATTIDVGDDGTVVASAAWVAPPDLVPIVHVCTEGCAETWSLSDGEHEVHAYVAAENGAIRGRSTRSFVAEIRRYDGTGALTLATESDPGFASLSVARDVEGGLWAAGESSGAALARRYNDSDAAVQDFTVQAERSAGFAVAPLPDGGAVLVGAFGPEEDRHAFVRVFGADGSTAADVDFPDDVAVAFDVAANDDELVVSTEQGVSKYTLDGDLLWSQPLGECRGVDMDTEGDVVAVCSDGPGALHRLSP